MSAVRAGEGEARVGGVAEVHIDLRIRRSAWPEALRERRTGQVWREHRAAERRASASLAIAGLHAVVNERAAAECEAHLVHPARRVHRHDPAEARHIESTAVIGRDTGFTLEVIINAGHELAAL